LKKTPLCGAARQEGDLFISEAAAALPRAVNAAVRT
jgi:hypothetical protein